MDDKQIQEAVAQLAKDGGITCREARRLAERLGIPYALVGKACDELEIKVRACELGCF